MILPFDVLNPFSLNTLVAAVLSGIQGIAGLFRNGEQGVWFDPSDLSTLFQDAAGTIPVTGMEQPVGLMLDKRLGLVRGPELVSNGDFSAGQTGWAQVIGTISVTAGRLRVARGGGNIGRAASAAMTCTIGKSYEVSYIKNKMTSGSSGLIITTSATSTVGAIFIANSGAEGAGRTVFTATQTTHWIFCESGSGVDGDYAEFDNISVRELPGNHATQATAAQRPILTARKNLLLNTHLSGGTAGTVGAGAVAPVGWVFPFTGGSVSYLTSQFGTGSVAFTKTLTTARPFIQQSIGVIASTTYTLSCRVSQAATGTMKIGDVCAWATLPAGSTQAYYKNGVLTTSSAIETLQLGDVISSVLTVSTTAGTVQARVGLGAAGDTSVTGTVSLTMPQIEVSVAPTRYQWVNTATDYDYAGFPIGLRCDGVDDGMVTGSIDFTGTDKMLVCAGVRKLSDAATAVLIELSSNQSVMAGAVAVTAPNFAAEGSYGSRSAGTAQSSLPAPGWPSPISSVVSAIAEISSDTNLIRVNGVQRASSAANQGAGNYGNYPLYLFRRGGSALPFNGLFYGAVIAGAAYSASQIASAERYLARKSGVTV